MDFKTISEKVRYEVDNCDCTDSEIHIEKALQEAYREGQIDAYEDSAKTITGELRPRCEVKHLIKVVKIEQLIDPKMCDLYSCFDLDFCRNEYLNKAQALRDKKP